MRAASDTDAILRHIPKSLCYSAQAVVAAAPETVWPLVADTGRLDHAIGLPAVHFSTKSNQAGGKDVIAEYRLGGIPVVRWTEAPFEWQFPRYYYATRHYHWGPLLRFKGGIELEPAGEGSTRVRFRSEFIPRSWLGWLAVKLLLGPQGRERVLRQCQIFERYLRGAVEDPFPQLRPDRQSLLRRLTAALDGRRSAPSQQAAEALPRAAVATGASSNRLRGGAASRHETSGAWEMLERQDHPKDLVGRLRDHLEHAPDEDVIKMRPFELADRWGAERNQTLVLFLSATTAGLVEMSWDVLCPSCRVGKNEYASLQELQPQGHCDTCEIAYDASFDQNVEVRFTISPALRHVANLAFCVGGPMNTPHVVSQLTLAPGQTATLETLVPPGTYRLRGPRREQRLTLEALQVPDLGSVGSSQEGPAVVQVYADRLEPAALRLPAGTLALMLANREQTPLTLKLERRAWPDTIATAALVSTLQAFRDLFSSEVLAPGVQVAIQRLAFIFTDLSGSTAMYQAVGQARAFRIVQDHFRILLAAISRNRGAVVKTIGDAVMATFPSAAAALEGALAIQREIQGLEADAAIDPSSFVKVGLHQGPCVAATANDRLDYFGTTVNIAARIEHECRGGQITMTEDVRQDPAVSERLAAGGFQLEPDVVPLRGIRAPVRIYRLVNPLST